MNSTSSPCDCLPIPCDCLPIDRVPSRYPTPKSCNPESRKISRHQEIEAQNKEPRPSHFPLAAMADIEVVELLDSDDDIAAPAGGGAGDDEVQEVEVQRAVRPGGAGPAGEDSDDDLHITGEIRAPQDFSKRWPPSGRCAVRAARRVCAAAAVCCAAVVALMPRCSVAQNCLALAPLVGLPLKTFTPHLTHPGLVGDDALVDYPHPRHTCAVFKFDTTPHATVCPNCWCVAPHVTPPSPSLFPSPFHAPVFRLTHRPPTPRGA